MAEFLSLETAGAEAVEATWQRFVPSARLERVDPRTFRFGWRSVAMDEFSVVAYELTAGVRAQMQPVDQFMACRVASRGCWVGNSARDLHPGMPWASVPGTTRARWNGEARVRAFIFGQDYAQSIARQISGDDRLVLRASDGAPHHPSTAAQWESVFRHVLEALSALQNRDEEGASRILESGLRRYALTATLASFGSSFTEAVERAEQRRAAPKTLRRAVAYVDAHAGDPITVDDIARASGISTRGLQQVFRRHLDVTPLEHLRHARLAAAHEELQNGAVTVAEVARRWGFSSASRFARYYREAYGRNPSRTLRD
jgi:AraC-like DNA-binding protein